MIRKKIHSLEKAVPVPDGVQQKTVNRMPGFTTCIATTQPFTEIISEPNLQDAAFVALKINNSGLS